MLWHKAWLETRSRFFISLIGTVVICSVFVLHGDQDAIYEVGADYYNYVLFGCHQILVLLWVLAVTLTMMGGLQREKAIGSSGFTLALPASRRRLMTVRICVGLLEALMLAIVPWGAMYSVASIFGKTHSVFQAAYYLALLLGGGLLFFAIAVLVSSVIGGEYTAPVVSCGLVVATSVALSSAALRPYSPWEFMTGAQYLNRQTNLLSFPIPWFQMAIYISVASALLALSVKVTQEQEF